MAELHCYFFFWYSAESALCCRDYIIKSEAVDCERPEQFLLDQKMSSVNCFFIMDKILQPSPFVVLLDKRVFCHCQQSVLSLSGRLSSG